MKPITKAIAVTLIQGLIVGSLGAKLLYDRRTRPQAWFLAQRYDPNLPIRGRYLSLQLEVKDPRTAEEIQRKFAGDIQFHENQRYNSAYGFGNECGSIELRDGSPIAKFDDGPVYGCENLGFQRWKMNGGTVLRVNEPVMFFIPDTGKDPSYLERGEDLWVLATIPRKGPPRPVALGIKKAGEQNVKRRDVN